MAVEEFSLYLDEDRSPVMRLTYRDEAASYPFELWLNDNGTLLTQKEVEQIAKAFIKLYFRGILKG